MSETTTERRYNPNTRRYQDRQVETAEGTRARQARAAVAGRAGAGGMADVVKASKAGAATQTDEAPKQKAGESLADFSRGMRAYRMKQAASRGRRDAMSGGEKPPE